MNNNELRELVHLLLMCGIMDKTATESGNVTDEEWLRMKNLIKQYQTEGGINCEPDKSGDLISREALKKAIFRRCRSEEENLNCFWYDENIVALINNAPTVEITEKQAILFLINSGWLVNHDKELREKWERPQGEWKLVGRDNQDIDVVCPFCNRTRFPAYSHGYTLEELEEYLIRQHLPKFCENCGAELKGGAEE